VVLLIRHSLCFKNEAARAAAAGDLRQSNRDACSPAPVTNPTQSATNLILRRDTDVQAPLPGSRHQLRQNHRSARILGRAGPCDTHIGEIDVCRAFSVGRIDSEAPCRLRRGLPSSAGCMIGTPLAHIETRFHPTPGGVWRLRERLKNSKRREFS
jgi:hypothetical protein